MNKTIKELRVKIDGLAQLTKELKPLNEKYRKKYFENGHAITSVLNPIFDGEPNKFNSKEIEKAKDSLYLAKAWLGKILQELGNKSPYGSGYKTKEDIKPTADTANKVKDFPLDSKKWADDIKNISYIEKVDWLRQEIDQIVLKVKHLDDGMTDHKHQRPTREFAIARTNSYNYLCEARFWLGFELERIKNEN